MMGYFASLAVLTGWLVVELKDIWDNDRLKNSLALPILKTSLIFSLITLILGRLFFPELLNLYLKEMREKAKRAFYEHGNYRHDNGSFVVKHKRNNSG
jgi:hypothetical protein